MVNPPGRPKGTLNKSSMRVELTCQVRKYQSIDAMIDAAQIALEKFIEHSEKEASGRYSPMESHAAEYLKIYVKIASEIASYCYPKLKSVEHKNAGPLDDMNPEQKLQAMEHAVNVMREKLKGNVSG